MMYEKVEQIRTHECEGKGCSHCKRIKDKLKQYKQKKKKVRGY